MATIKDIKSPCNIRIHTSLLERIGRRYSEDSISSGIKLMVFEELEANMQDVNRTKFDYINRRRSGKKGTTVYLWNEEKAQIQRVIDDLEKSKGIKADRTKIMVYLIEYHMTIWEKQNPIEPKEEVNQEEFEAVKLRMKVISFAKQNGLPTDDNSIDNFIKMSNSLNS